MEDEYKEVVAEHKYSEEWFMQNKGDADNFLKQMTLRQI
jgi:hypothetical protein